MIPRRRRKCESPRIYQCSTFFQAFLLLSSLQYVHANKEVKNTQQLEDLFGQVDRNGDGEIGRNEANQFVSKISCPEDDRNFLDFFLKQGVDFSFSYGGSSISTSELSNHLTVLTEEWVTKWVEHGLNLPQYATAFRKESVDGYDFLTLISNNGSALKNELNIQSELHFPKIYCAIRRQILGIGKAPSSPLNLNCSSETNHGIRLQWLPPSITGTPPVHKYLIQRRVKDSFGWETEWKTIGESKELSFSDYIKNASSLTMEFDYRLQSWGGHGPSDWIVVENCQVKFGISPEEESLTVKWIITGICFICVGILFRHITFYDIAMAIAYFLMDKLKLRCVLASKFFAYSIERMAFMGVYFHAKSINICEYLKVIQLAVTGMIHTKHDRSNCIVQPTLLTTSPQVLSCDPSTVQEGILLNAVDEREEVALDAVFSMGSNYSKSVEKSIMERRDGNAVKRVNDRRVNGVIYGDENEDEDQSIGRRNEDLVLNGSDSTSDIDRQKIKLKLPSLEKNRSVNRSRYKCNENGCSVQFNWYTFSGVKGDLFKHYCKDCQGVYCIDHTRVSPHGSIGKCGLDTECICCSCFDDLSNKRKSAYDEKNKLRKSSSSSSAKTSSRAYSRWSNLSLSLSLFGNSKTSSSSKLTKNSFFKNSFSSTSETSMEWIEELNNEKKRKNAKGDYEEDANQDVALYRSKFSAPADDEDDGFHPIDSISIISSVSNPYIADKRSSSSIQLASNSISSSYGENGLKPISRVASENRIADRGVKPSNGEKGMNSMMKNKNDGKLFKSKFKIFQRKQSEGKLDEDESASSRGKRKENGVESSVTSGLNGGNSKNVYKNGESSVTKSNIFLQNSVYGDDDNASMNSSSRSSSSSFSSFFKKEENAPKMGLVNDAISSNPYEKQKKSSNSKKHMKKRESNEGGEGGITNIESINSSFRHGKDMPAFSVKNESQPVIVG